MSRHINLLDESLLPPKRPVSAIALAVAFGLTLLAMGGWSLVAGSRASGVMQEMNRVDEALRPVQESLAAMQEQHGTQTVNVSLQASIAEAELQLAARREIREAVQRGDLGSTAGFSPLLKAFARRTVSGAWLTGIELEQGSRELVLRGLAVEPARVAALMQALGEDEALRGFGVAGLAVRVESRRGAGTFAFTAAATPDAAQAAAGAGTADEVAAP